MEADLMKKCNVPISIMSRNSNGSTGIMVVWLECRFLDTEVDGSDPAISMLFP